MEKKLKIAEFSFLGAALYASAMFYWGMFGIFGAVTDQLKSLVQMLPMFFLGGLSVTYLFVLFRQFFVRGLSKKGIIVFLAVTGLVMILSIAVIIIYSHFYFANTTNWWYRTAMIIQLLVFISLDVLALIGLKRGKIGVQKEPFFADQFPYFEKSRGIALGFYLPFALFFLGDFLMAFWRFKNYSINFCGYLLLLLFLLVLSLNVCEMVTRKEGERHDIFRFATFGLTLLFQIIYYVIFFAFNDVILLVGQPLFIIDFATVGPIGPTIMTVLSLCSLIPDLIWLIKGRKEIKAE